MLLNVNLESNSPDILAQCEITHTHGLAIYMKEEFPFAQDSPLENSADSYLHFQLALLYSASYFFFLYQSSSWSLCMVFDAISSKGSPTN